jgi:prepilin-type N-terminal cleavage/methylation domain-containing protein
MMHAKRGFTLIELLVVIAIIGLLATFAVVSLSGTTSKVRDATRKSDLKAIQKALELYYADNGIYPSSGGSYRGTCPNWGSYGRTGSTGYIPNLAPSEISILPADPKPMAHPDLWSNCTLANSCYLYRSDGFSYKVLAYCDLENGAPPPSDPLYDPYRPTYAAMVCGGRDLATICDNW